jgi:hypothetical protein
MTLKGGVCKLKSTTDGYCHHHRLSKDVSIKRDKHICKGTILSTGKLCTSKAKDINGFCHKHIKQSQEYDENNPWSVILKSEGSTHYYVKVKGIVEGAFMTSRD